MAYTDEVWLRARAQFNTNQQMLAWLNSFERPAKGANAYTRDALKVRNDLRMSVSIIEDLAPNARNFREIARIERQANEIETNDIRSEALGVINEKIRFLDGEAEEFASQFKSAETRTDRERAEEKLRDLSPQSLGGIKSGEKRRAASAFRSVFG